MDDLDLSGDTTDKEQEDLPYDGDLIENTELLHSHTEIFPSIKEKSEAFQQSVFSNAEMPQIDIPRCANDTFLETSVTKKHSEECCTRYFDIPTNNEEPSNSKISDILLHHLSKKGFSNAIQPVDCKTYPEVSIETFDETIFKSLILHCSASSLSREINTDLSDQLLHKRNVMCNQSSQRQLTEKEKIFHFDFEEPVIPEDYFPGDPYLITENRSPSYLQTMCSGQTAQKYLFERLSSDSRLKYGQDQVHDPLPDFFQVTPQIRISKPNSHHRLATVVQQTNSSPNLNEKSAVVQGDLESMAMNFLDRKPQENKEETIELTQYLQVNGEPLLDVSERAFSGLASETNVLKLSSSTKEQLPSSPSQLLTKAERCQELSEQTKNLKTKVEEFSKRISQDFTPLEDNKQVLEELQRYLDVLEENYLSTKEKHQVLQKYHKDSTAVGEFDPERKVEGEIFKVEMLLENVKEKIDESTSSSFFACSSDTLDFLDFALCPLPNEVPPQKIGHDPSEKSDHEIKLLDLEKQDQENTVIPFLKEKDKDINQKEVIPAEIQETLSQDYLCELYPQIYLGLPRRDVAFDEDASKYSSKEEVVTLTRLETNQLAVKLSADFMRAFSSLESDNDPGSLESIKQSVLRQDWHSDHELPESSKHTEYPLLKKDQDKDRDLRNQKKEKKNDSRKSKCGKFSVIIQEKAMNLNVSDSTYCTDAGNGVFSDSRDTSKPDECLSCRNRRHKSRKKEFHYKYNCTGQNPLNFNECDGFIRFCSLSRNKSFTSALATHQKWDENLAEHPKNQHSKRSEKNKPVCSQQKKYQPLRITTKCSQSQDEMILAEKNLMSSKSCPGICDQIANSPHYHSCRISGSKTLHSIQNIKRNDSEILNSALDYALRTAITLKETTEQMIQAIAKDLAKAEGRRNRQKF
ncbi:protein AKNAD1 isoform X3 [Sarcophilus harrisii]|uniref:protein AKNAD1 isoform X3 n=1 Tax=Sarcophilus harrisii TaxID=9305 RepID=UPI001301B96F|nr:protein AKNAD1 isoform X3 [Sarcophilus harrisii]